ncbi:glycosyltransferase 61 family protein [Asticcacaulis excentricus]|uniref:glycosyltransferase 61 family protein n=1 Tax=Asticcacaulis excentricus TaxID=78587 RepID=UPI00117F0DDB|nr:glycosyltransferase family 61 protein [Asticcacaulis excentricus]
MADKINSLSRLPQSDKDRLIEGLIQGGYHGAETALPELSIFRPRNIQNIDAYRYSVSNDTLYYIGDHNRKHHALFFDDQGKIEFNSRYYCTHLVNFLQLIDQALFLIEESNISSATNIGENFVAIEKWFLSYGHFQDELFSINDFMQQMNLFGKATGFLDYPTDSHLDTENFKFNTNYQILDRAVFGESSLNAYTFGDGILKLRGLTLIENHITSPNFHRFPSSVSSKARLAALGSGESTGPEKVFITRSSSYRDIGNKDEAEAFFADQGFLIVNPEDISIIELIRVLANVKYVGMYFGSAMTNMIYMPKGTKVHVIQAKSYLHEGLEIWQNILKEYNIDLNVHKASDENVVDIEMLKALAFS